MSTLPVSLDPLDAIELAELLGYLADWIATSDTRLHVSHEEFTNGLYTLDELRDDLARFAFLVVGDERGFRW